MEPRFSRRGFMNTAVGLGLATQRGLGQQVASNDRRPVVAVVKGEERRKIVHDALMAIDDQIKPVLQQKKYVVLKPNNVSTVNQLAATHLDALRGILDYLAPRFKGPVVIAESSAGNTMEGFENFRYGRLASEFRSQHVTLTDLNEEAKYELVQVLDENLHIIPVRLAARLLDPDAFVLCPAILKTHNTVVATLSVKNMVLGAPLHQAPKETKRWNDKRKFHTGLRQTHYNMMVTAQKMAPFWGATVIDGYEGMEGNGPASGTPVPSRVAIASTDFIAADRVGVEAMGIDASWLAYLQYCSAAGIGQYDLAKIALRGEPLAGVRRSYRMHGDIERELRWRGPMTDIPEKIG
jgi:uncharacterized protein (DUF362 family)